MFDGWIVDLYAELIEMLMGAILACIVVVGKWLEKEQRSPSNIYAKR
jgi:hypothetical protein